jgi:hypothetical protein
VDTGVIVMPPAQNWLEPFAHFEERAEEIRQLQRQAEEAAERLRLCHEALSAAIAGLIAFTLSDPFKQLESLAKSLRLKGRQAQAVAEIVRGRGKCQVAVLANMFKWPSPSDNWNSMKKALNKKFNAHGWHFDRRDSNAVASRGPSQA